MPYDRWIKGIRRASYPLNKWIKEGNDPSECPDDWLMTLDKSCHSKADAQPGEFKLPPKEE